jgi:hypothetical protein
MPHDVFINNSTAGKLTAYAICSELESGGIRCWILPRDLDVESGWDQSIVNAVACCRVMIVVLSDYASRSDRVERQLELAFNKGMVVIPFRTESTLVDCEPQPATGMVHWLDAMTPEMVQRMEALRDMVRVLIEGPKDDLPQVGTLATRREETPPLNVGSFTEFPQPEALEVPTLPTATGLVEGSLVSEAGNISLPDFENLGGSTSESEGAVTQKSAATSKRFPIKPLLLVLLPFAILCGVGFWQAKNWYSLQPPHRAAATATPSMAPPVLANIQHQDRIPAADPGWGALDANWRIADGKLQVTPLPNSSAVLINHGRRFKDAEITAETTMSGGENLDQLGGLIFWAKDYNDCYAFVISADGKFAIGRKLIGRWINPIAKTGNPAIKTGIRQVNKLSVRTDGNQLTASINNIQVATLESEAPQGVSNIGLYGESAETAQNVWEFTNVTVTTKH